MRSDAIRAVVDYLAANYSGPVSISSAEDDGDLSPPYAVVRVGTAENIGGGQANIWDMTIMVGVFHDSDATASAAAEAQAQAVFDELADPDAFATGVADALVVSWWDPVTTEAAIEETRWQHVAGFRLIASPPEA